jgi:hypothetical protein
VKRLALTVLVAGLSRTLSGAPAYAHPDQHGEPEGHLIGAGDWGKIDLVGGRR